MSFRIRRGTEAQRAASPAFDLGEPVWTIDKQKLYIGDGVTPGGVPVIRLGTGLAWADVNGIPYITATGGGGGGGGGGITAIVQDTNPQLGGNLSLNSNNIGGTGNISITGSLSTTGTANLAGGLGGNLNLNNYAVNGTGSINITGAITATTIRANTGLGANLSLNGFNITGTGNINNTGTITATSITTNGALTVGGGVAGVLSVNYITGGASAINLKSNNNSAVNIQSFTSDGTNVNSVSLSIQVSRGSLASPTTVQASDVLGGLIISGYNGTDYKPAGFITSQLDAGAVLSDAYPASIIGFGSGGGGMVINIAKLDAKGRWNAPRLQVTAYATGSYPASPIQGEIIFDSTTKKFMGHNGTAWVAFTGP
jgi:hypothetical protein